MQKIFVIEDDENIRNLVKIALEGYGYQVLAFETAEEALELVGKEQPDLAVFDLMLPGMDGIEICDRVRAESGVPIIMLTARTDTADVVLARGRNLQSREARRELADPLTGWRIEPGEVAADLP